ncbi:MAG: hypothetical protein U0744_16840 [Gemmataceae bacterium]
MFRRLQFVFVSLMIVAPVFGQDSGDPSINATFIRRVEAKKPFPSTIHFRLEIRNPRDRVVWLATSFGSNAAFPEGGRFKANVEEGFPFSCIRLNGFTKQGNGAAYVVTFLGFDRFTAFALPPRSKLTIDDFEVAGEDVRHFEVWEAAAISIQGKTPLEKWLPFSPICDRDIHIPADVKWVDALEDPKSKDLRSDLPKEKVEFVTFERTRTVSVSLEAYRGPHRHFAKKVAGTEGTLYGWQDAGAFPSKDATRATNLAFSRDGSSLMIALENLKLTRLNLKTDSEEADLGHEPLGRWMGFDANGAPLVSRLESNDEHGATLLISEWPAGKLRRKLHVEHLGGIWHGKSVLAPDGRKAAILHSKVVELAALDKDADRAQLQWHDATPGQSLLNAAFSPDGSRLAVGFGFDAADGAAVVWDLATKKAIHQFRAEQSALQFLAFSPDGSELAATGKHPVTIWVYDLADKGRDRVLRNDRPAEMRSLAWSPDGKFIAVNTKIPRNGTNEGAISLLNANTGEPIGALPGFAEWAGPIVFSPDGSTIAATDARGTIRVWKKTK